MERRRRDNQRRRRPPPSPGIWEPIVPAWEREFCKLVGSMDWETLLQKKKYMHLYENVMEWNDTAGKEAFSNAKIRYWAKINGLSCYISLPDPDLYTDKINWDSEIDLQPELFSDVESLPMSSNTEEDHEPVVIFGDSGIPNQVVATIGWGDDEENVVAPATCSSTNYVNPWGHSSNEWAQAAWPGYSNDGWRGYSDDAWQYRNGSGNGYMPWVGDWSNWGWNYAGSSYNYIGPEIKNMLDGGDRRHGNACNIAMTGSGGCLSSYAYSRVEANEQQREHDKAPYQKSSTREWNSNSITVDILGIESKLIRSKNEPVS